MATSCTGDAFFGVCCEHSCGGRWFILEKHSLLLLKLGFAMVIPVHASSCAGKLHIGLV